MKSATVHEIKQELQQLPAHELVELCLRLARFKKENKELLTYLLFEAHDEEGYIRLVKESISADFGGINRSSLYFAKKTLRKILRTINKYCRYTGSKQAEVEWLIHYCQELKATGIEFEKSPALLNLYQAQLKKISKVIYSLHEDLQFEYRRELKKLG